jgi:hypothetical protein
MSDGIWFQTSTREMIEEATTEVLAKNVLLRVADMIADKNKKYGDSALSPIQIFSRLDSSNALKVRIDDKLTRIANSGLSDDTEDTLMDLIGYMALLVVAVEKDKNSAR